MPSTLVAGPAAPPRRARLVPPRADAQTIIAIFVGGALGTLARAALAEAFPHSATEWPWPTFAVNIVAALLLGYFVTRLQERLPLSSYRRPLLGTGVCGGLSTFSTMQVEILKMLSAHAYGLAAGVHGGEHRGGLRGAAPGDRAGAQVVIGCAGERARLDRGGPHRRRRLGAAVLRGRPGLRRRPAATSRTARWW